MGLESDFRGKHATSLKIIIFRELKLKTGSWEIVFIGMKKLLTLSSVYIRGDFDTGRVMEIKSGLTEHGRRVLSNEAIEDFIQRKTDDNPFDLLRSARRDYPPQPGGDWQCMNGCSYRQVVKISNRKNLLVYAYISTRFSFALYL